MLRLTFSHVFFESFFTVSIYQYHMAVTIGIIEGALLRYKLLENSLLQHDTGA